MLVIIMYKNPCREN